MAAAVVQHRYSVVMAGLVPQIQKTTIGPPTPVQSNIDYLTKEDYIRRFYCDVIKDSQETPPINNILNVLVQCIPPPVLAPPPVPPPVPPLIPPNIGQYHIILQQLEQAVNQRSTAQITEYKNILKTSTVGSNIQISDAEYVFWESGFGCRSVCRNQRMKTVKTSAATLDSLPKQSYDDTFNPYVTFSASFTQALGFPTGFEWTTQPNGFHADESRVTINFDGVAANVVGSVVNNRIRNIGAAFTPYVLGNRDKNQNINGRPLNAANCPMIKKLLIMKEIGDVAQVWMYLAYADINNATPRNQLLMVTTDSVVYLLCMLLDLSCIYTGARAGVSSGCCTLKHYLSGPIDYIARCKNMMEVYKQKVVQHNTSITFALKIMLADPSNFDYYIHHAGAAPHGCRRVLATKGLTPPIRILVNQMIQREINRIELATAAIEAIFVNVTKILIIIPALFPVQAAAFAAYHYFITAAEAAAAAAAAAAAPVGAPPAAVAQHQEAVLAAAVPTALPLVAGAENAARDAAQQTVIAAAVPPAAAAAPPAVPAAAAAVAAAVAAVAAAAAAPAVAAAVAAAAAAAALPAGAVVPAAPAVPAAPPAPPAVVAAILLAALAGRAAGAAAAKAQVAKLQAQGAAVTMAAVLAGVITVSTLSVVTFAAQVVTNVAAAAAAAAAVDQSITDTYSNFCKSIDIFKEPALFTQLPNKRYIILPGRFLNQFVRHVYNPPLPLIPQNIVPVIAAAQAAAAAANVRLYGGSRNRIQHAGRGEEKRQRLDPAWVQNATDEPDAETNFYDCLIGCYVANRINLSIDPPGPPSPPHPDPADNNNTRPVPPAMNNGITDFVNNYDYPNDNSEIEYNIQIAFALEWDMVVNELMNEEHKIYDNVNSPIRHGLQTYMDNLVLNDVSDASIITRGKRLLKFVYLASDLAIETAELEKRISKAQQDRGYPPGISAITPVQDDWVIDTRFHTWLMRRRGRRNIAAGLRHSDFPYFRPSLYCGNNKNDKITNKHIDAAFAILIQNRIPPGVNGRPVKNEMCYDVTTFVSWLKKNQVTVDNLLDFYTQQPLDISEKRQIANYIIMVYRLTSSVMDKLGTYADSIKSDLVSYNAQQDGGGMDNTNNKRKTIKRKLHYKNRSKNQKRVNKHRITRRNNKTHRRTRKHRN